MYFEATWMRFCYLVTLFGKPELIFNEWREVLQGVRLCSNPR